MTISRSARPYLWVLGVLWVLPAVAVVTGYLLLPEDPPHGQCEGIGFGCVPAPNDSFLILGMLAAPLFILAGLIAIASMSFIDHRRHIKGRDRSH